jgi:uncharacterized Zn finger protein
MLIVLDCPSCAKRYEVDGALAGKKSRCKDCGEVFLIPVPRGRQSERKGKTTVSRSRRRGAG